MTNQQVLTILALEELKELGYKKVWIGKTTNPHWPNHGCDNFIIAAPKKRIHGTPALWTASKEAFGEMGCGNGLRNADQCQRENARNMIPGHYWIQEGRWNSNEIS